MSVPNTSTGLLNPDVYLNNLSPSEAKQIEVSRNITLVVLGAIIWDVLVYISEDVQILRRSKLRFVSLCFIFTRLAAAIYVFIDSIERVTPIGNLRAMLISGGTLCMVSMIMSSYLFLQRVQAVYAEEQWVRWVFLVFWVIQSASDILIPARVGLRPTVIPGTHYCLDAGIPPYVALSIFTLLLFDTSVLLAISYKIALRHVSMPMNERVSWYALISGRTLPRLSRAVLRGGQQYYLITVGMTILVGVTVTLPSIPQIFKTTFPTAMVPLTASMACRVFRNTKLFDLNTSFMATRAPTTLDV